jgi:hypothetical protein
MYLRLVPGLAAIVAIFVASLALAVVSSVH